MHSSYLLIFLVILELLYISFVSSELTYRPGKHLPAVDQSKSRDRMPRTTPPCKQGGIASRPCDTTRITRTTAPSDQEGLVPRPAESFDQYHPSGRTRRTNE
ncbi:unnamed protein product [Microthlaspi erraticum]|uniref:Uncharacterized protein n=1 Tax=Microthlaspi erraticum TaxID=1685480 RepID=A0A6D2J470_9BRAS|nr:unnamed protein product [Microthlaspi erraticum]